MNYALIIVLGCGAAGPECNLEHQESYFSKASCEVMLPDEVYKARNIQGQAPDDLRTRGVCMELKK